MANCSCSSQGALTRLLIEPGASTHTFDASSEVYEFHRCTIAKRGRSIGARGIRGTLSRPIERLREGSYYVYGTLVMDVSPADFQDLLPHMGFPNFTAGSPPPDTFAVDDCSPYFGMLIDKGADIYQYKDCKINRWILEGRAPRFGEEGEPDLLKLTLEIFCSDELTGQTWPASYAALGTAAKDAPYVLYDADPGASTAGSMSFYAEEREVLSFRLWQDLKQQLRYSNSLLAKCISARDRVIGCDIIMPFNSDDVDVYGKKPSNAAAATILFSNGTLSTKFNIGRFDAPDNGPVIRGKEELYYEMRGFCYSVSLDISVSPETGTREMEILNDATA